MFKNLLILSSVIALTACQSVPVKIAETKKAQLPTPKTIVDSDNDGVPDNMDKCPNTPLNVVVDERGCPRPYATDLDMIRDIEMRVFYDKNKVFPSERYLTDDIAKMGEKLNESPNAYIILEGHASKIEDDKDGNGISHERVLIIKQLLKEEYHIADNRIKIESYGYQRPIAPNTTEEGRKMNQRVYGVLAGRK